MLRILAILTVVGAMLLPATAVFADEGGQDRPVQVAPIQAQPITVGTVAGADNNPPALEYHESGSNRD